MYRILLIIWLALIILTPSLWAMNDDNTGFQMDTSMSETLAPSQNDSTLRFLQTLTNQQEEIQNLNLTIQQNKRNAKIESENLDHRISFITFLLWGVLAINGILLFILIIMGFRLSSLSRKINAFQVEMDAIQTEIKTLPFADPTDKPSPKVKGKKQILPAETLDLSQAEEQELEGFLASGHDTGISEDEGKNFFQHFQSEIDRERTQLKQTSKSETESEQSLSEQTSQISSKSENELLDELIEAHFSDEDIVNLSSKK